MSETQQRTIFGEEINEQVRVETTGRVIRPFKRMLDQVAKEYKLRFGEDGLNVSVVDAANVQMVDLTLEADAFEDYWTEGITIGTNGTAFGSALQHARYGVSTDDPVILTAEERHLETETTRTFGDMPATVNERAETIDPDAIRQQPDLPDLDFDVTVDVDPRTFIEVIGAMDTNGTDPIKLGANPESIVFNQEADLQQRNIRIDCDPSDVCEWSMHSPDYMEQLAKAIQVGYVDSLTLKWAEEYPLVAEVEREGVMHGQIMTAPRIGPD